MSKNKDKHIGVLLGGLSSEREISLRSGKAIAQALRNLNYYVSEIDVDRDLPDQLKEKKIEVAFIALHGRYGEDGAVQGLLEMMQVPYTGSGVLASALCMDKILTKKIVAERGFWTPASTFVEVSNTDFKDVSDRISLSFPVIVKPATEGSTVGITQVKEQNNLSAALEIARGFDRKILIEEFIQGKEVTAGVLNGKALPLIEIAPKSGFYDFHSKYTKGATDYILPARISEELTREIQESTVEIYHELGCEGVGRADYIIDSEDRPFFLEINTIPGMTETSLIPKAAAHAGLTFEKLVENILDSARLKLGSSVKS